ncbi:MAG: DUF2391 family protein [Candidatus Woesearchaeota archaeon]
MARALQPSLKQIASDVRLIREEMVEKVPSHFSPRHITSAFFGALFIGMMFVIKGLLLQVASILTSRHLWIIAAATFIILTGEIYFVGYSRVKDKSKRPFGQFWFKRIVSYSIIAVLVSYFLVYIYGINILAGANTYKVIVALLLPCAVGASLADLLKQY